MDLEEVINAYKDNYSDYITLCAIRHNDRYYCVAPMSETIMKYILQYEAYYCLIHYLHMYQSLTEILFWTLYDGRSKILYDMMKMYAKGIDESWMSVRVNGVGYEELYNILSWMGESYIADHARDLIPYAHIIGKIYPVDFFIRHMLLSPSHSLDMLVQKMSTEDKLRDSIGILKADKVFMRQMERKYNNVYPTEYTLHRLFHSECAK